jgi:ERF superfamily protein
MIETLIETSPEIGELAKALPKAQAAITKITKDATNTHFSNKYATLTEITDAIRPAMNDHGFSVFQFLSAGAGAVQVTTRLQHESAQFIQATHTVPVSKGDAQGFGSAATYARRQALQAFFAVAPEGEDDDGEGSVGRGAGRPPLPPKEPDRPSLLDRAARLEKTLGEVKLIRDLDRAWKLAADLIAELRDKEPATAARVEALHDERHAALIGGAG